MSTQAVLPTNSVIIPTQNSIDTVPQLRPHQWQKGQSGNPGGRPKRKPITETMEALLSDPVKLRDICEAQIKAAKKGKVDSFCAIRDTVEGKPQQTIENRGEAVVQINIAYMG